MERKLSLDEVEARFAEIDTGETEEPTAEDLATFAGNTRCRMRTGASLITRQPECSRQKSLWPLVLVWVGDRYFSR